MERDGESVHHRCDICHRRNAADPVVLEEQEKVLYRKVLAIVCPVSSYPFHLETSCAPCLAKLHNLKAYLREILLTAIRIHRIHVKNMQEDGREAQKKADEKHYERYNCQCAECQIKFGGLALLVDVIERREEKTEERISQEPQPSTSRQSPPPMPPTESRKQMRCGHCGKTFTHKGDLNKHLRKHTGEQPFVCPVCHRRFAHTSNLSRHLRLHSGSRPFACDICDKRFSRKDKLDLHRKSKYCKKSK